MTAPSSTRAFGRYSAAIRSKLFTFARVFNCPQASPKARDLYFPGAGRKPRDSLVMEI